MNRSRFPKPIRRALRGLMHRAAISGSNVATGFEFNVGRGAIISSPHSLTFGDHVSVGPRSVIQVDGTIGNFVMIGMNVYIVGRNDHALDEVGVPMLYSTWAADRPQTPSDVVTIGDDVWIGASSVILSGTSIGTGAVVGAGAVVTSDVPEFGIVVGVPARLVGCRFENSNADKERHKANLKTFAPDANPAEMGQL